MLGKKVKKRRKIEKKTGDMAITVTVGETEMKRLMKELRREKLESWRERQKLPPPREIKVMAELIKILIVPLNYRYIHIRKQCY